MPSSLDERAERLDALRDRVFGPRTEEERRYAEDPGTLRASEKWWRDHYEMLLEHGYTLRPRFNPNWSPPWKDTRRFFMEYEEGQQTDRVQVLDATRNSDGAYVTLKKLNMARGRSDMEEVEINQYLSSEPLSLDPRNHCAQSLEIFPIPDTENVYMMVMPTLRPFDNPVFATFGEAVAFFTQLFEGLQFLHERKIAHRDCCRPNIMMDATSMYPKPWHFVELNMRRDWKGKAKHYTRTERPVKYYYVDFGLSQHYKPEDILTWPPLTLPVHGADKTAPENRDEKYETPCNPFATDIYYLGNLIRQSFMQKYYGFGFMKELVADMVLDDPSKRPDINEVVTRFAKIRESLHSWKLRSRTIRRKEWKIVTLWRYPTHIFRTIRFIVTRKPAIPDP
ncbi:hypothetical protein EVG20_g9481 [Dentipellis fragilis]|uniref:Protein kinase domain-containing protein n=1 Tax=Dentipellis fragilis TaxID=205917 RepID=A0A4Y9XZ85_9AGAM|nr:hypothetical protein EVG20_g9481 [Dentipellis fragilis]